MQNQASNDIGWCANINKKMNPAEIKISTHDIPKQKILDKRPIYEDREKNPLQPYKKIERWMKDLKPHTHDLTDVILTEFRIK